MGNNFITSFEEHILIKSLNEGLNSFITGTFNKREALSWLTKDGLKYIASYMSNNPGNNILKPFLELYRKNKELTNNWTNAENMESQFIEILNHFNNVTATHIKGGQPTHNTSTQDVKELGLNTWEDAEILLFSFNKNESFNDAGEPLMTHNQYRDYSQPSQPDEDDYKNVYEEDITPTQIVKQIENHFDTILETYDKNEYTFLLNGEIKNQEILLYFFDNKVSIAISSDNEDIKEVPAIDIDDVDVNSLLQFLEPYRQYILSGEAAEEEMNKINQYNSAQDAYARQERRMTGSY